MWVREDVLHIWPIAWGGVRGEIYVWFGERYEANFGIWRRRIDGNETEPL